MVYQILESDRAKRMRIAVYPGGKVIVTKPKGLSLELAKEFVRTKEGWVLSKIEKMNQQKSPDLTESSYKHFLFNRGAARSLVLVKLKQWNEAYNYEYRKVAIKQLHSRWGSCSSEGNLSFNYKIIFLPEVVQDYIIIHELCHLRQANHSPAFWNLVALTLPDFREIRTQIAALT